MLRLIRNPRLVFAVAVVGGLLALALWPQTLPVEAATVARGPLVVTVDEEGETRVRERYVVSAPVSGRVLRIELEPGDTVRRGQVVARLRPEVSPLLDARARAEAGAAAETARAAVGRMRAEEARARAALGHAQRELIRLKDLDGAGLTTRQQVETAEADVRVLQQGVEAGVFAARAAESEVRRAEARLRPAASSGPERVVPVTSPVDGVVLKRVRESESLVAGGEALLEIGNPARREIVSDLLSTDAVKVSAGARAIVDQWGGPGTLAAHVRRVEPSGFTKVSALGVEEQRVNVVLDFDDPATAIALGDAYRVEVAIVVWEGADVLRVPTAALFRQGDAWAVYVVAGGRTHVRSVQLGHRTGQEAEVLGGLTAGDVVVVHPGDAVTDGARVEVAR